MSKTNRPEMYERAPDGAQWPGTLAGLLLAMDDTAWESALHGDQRYTLSAIRDGHAMAFRNYHNGIGLAA
jgi:hypothetical protein